MFAPVVLFIYNRPTHTEVTLKYLSLNTIAREIDIYIFCDGPKNEDDKIMVNKTREAALKYKSNNKFRSVSLYYSDNNKGLANSVISGVTQLLNKNNKIIVMEDDLISSRDFLEFMNEALEFYKDNNSIWSISGYNLPIEIPKEYNKDIYLAFRGSSWGWGTWKDRWETVDWDMTTYSKFKYNFFLRMKFSKGGRDLPNMLDLQMQKKIDSWAIRWCYTQFQKKMFSIYPVQSRIQNIGLDGSGTHSANTNRFNSKINDNFSNVKFENIELNKNIVKKFRNYYLGFRGAFILNIKTIIKKIFRV